MRLTTNYKDAMTKILCTIFFALTSVSVFATVRTVNNSDSTAQFKTISSAITASSAGDTIYVSGSSIDYASFTLTKRLAIFGPGWAPSTASGLAANVAGCSLTSNAARGSEFHGLTFNGVFSIAAVTDSLIFLRNRFQSTYISITSALKSFLFDGNWFDNSYLYNPSGYAMSDFVIRNNIFYNTSASSFSLYNIRGSNILLDHNLWYGPSTGSVNCFYTTKNLTLFNNIFVRRNASNGLSNSSFQDNITYLCINDTPWIKTGITNDGGNIAATDPKMVDQASVNSGINNPLLNFTIQSGAANNAGNDGKDMGLLYDIDRSNWTRCRAANLPFISNMTLKSGSVPFGTNIEVTVDAKAN